MALVSMILYFILLLLPGHEFCFYNTVVVTVILREYIFRTAIQNNCLFQCIRLCSSFVRLG